MARFTRPGVKVLEQDFSEVIGEAQQTLVGLVVDSPVGPVGETSQDTGINLVANTNQFIREYRVPETNLELTAVNALRANDTANVSGRFLIKRALPRDGNGDILALWGGVESQVNSGTQALGTGVVFPIENYSPGPNTRFAIFAQQPSDENANVAVKIISGSGEADEFEVEVWTREDANDSFVLEESHLVTQVDKLDPRGRQMNLEERLKRDSNFVLGINNPDENSQPETDGSLVALGGGTSGGTVDENDLITAVQVFRNSDDVEIRIIPTGGVVNKDAPNFANELWDICADRQDCVAFIDVPRGLNGQEIVEDFLPNLTQPNVENAGSYMALFAPWVKDFEIFKQKVVTIPPTGHIVQNAIISFALNEPWFSFAGLNRGVLGVDQLNQVFSGSEKDLLFENKVNYIIDDSVEGPTLFTQQTFHQPDSALDQLNVRFLLLEIEGEIADRARRALQDFNQEITRRGLRIDIENRLSNVQGRRGLDGFNVILDESNNPPSIVDARKMVVDIIIDPANAIAFIELNFRISESGNVGITENVFS